ncbi:MAG TPA: Smr/MutS family protein [Thermoanaerobaculia bacterium]|nr:Smr/MutS family protein [Thermoanaerobaculia bacterium]
MMTSESAHETDLEGFADTDGEAVLSAATALALELPSLLAVLAQFASTDLGRDRALALAPFAEEAALEERRERTQEASRLLIDGALVPDFDVPVGELVERLATGRPPLAGGDLVRLADLGRSSRAAVARIRGADACPALARLAAPVPDLTPLLARIDKALDRRGEVREDASPKLLSLRQQIRRVRGSLYEQLGGFVQQHKEELSEETIPLRGGRLVLVLQAGAKGRTGGLIHGRSATGKSYYFEPLEAVEANNELQQSVEDEEAERRRILSELIGAARAELPALAEIADFVAELDLLQAALRFADVAEARLPEIAPRSELRLVRARHPLLDARLADARREALGQPGHEGTIVPLDLELSAGRRMLVVTGPNAGGKTVALKTAGLLSAAALCGLPIPAAAGSRVPFLTRLVATVGDEQDLLTDRSTFSGRLLRLKEAWEAAGPDSLILLDELGSGTDPEEGAALSTSLLEGLAERGSLAVITTHLTQLAAAALETDGATCAAMEFDATTGGPTFRLVPGPPGASEALALARRLGLPAEWLDRAEARLGSEHRDLRRLLGEVERARRELAETRSDLERERADAEKLRRRLAEELAAAAEERKSVGKKLQRDLEAFRRETSARLREEIERLRERFAQGKRKGLDAEAVERLFAAAPELAPAEEAPEGPLVVGRPVRHVTLGWQGTLERLDGDRAEVAVRGKRVRCRAGELAPAEPAGPAGPEAGERSMGIPRSRGGRSSPANDAVEEIRSEINLIGQRVEPALETLDAYLDQALRGPHREVRIVHGHGTGKLRNAVRDHLRGHRAVADLRVGEPNEGGNGATIVTLRGA